MTACFLADGITNAEISHPRWLNKGFDCQLLRSYFGFQRDLCDGGFVMEKPPYEFRKITHFSVGDVEKVDPGIDCITRLTLEVGSELPNGKYSLRLFKPFPPLGRAGGNLSKLRSLLPEDIESISAFRKPDAKKSARIEIYMKTCATTVVVKCERIEGVAGWDADQID
jgi:hypothetical protein